MSAIHGKCPSCGHVWLVARLPMELGKAATTTKRASCAECGETKGILIANDADVALAARKVAQE